MTDDRNVLDRLDRYAKAIARNRLHAFDLGFDSHRVEDIAQTLFLAGWQVWKDTGNEGLAKHRMSSRADNETKKLETELKQPRPISSLPLPNNRHSEDADTATSHHVETADQPYRRLQIGVRSRASPMEDMIVQEYLDGLTPRQRRIVECRMAQMTVPEISQTLGVSTSTIERELTLLQKGFKHDQGD